MTTLQSRLLVSRADCDVYQTAHFISATKCDDISCSEVIRALNLEGDPDLESTEDQIDTCKVEIEELKERKSTAEAIAKGLLSHFRR